MSVPNPTYQTTPTNQFYPTPSYPAQPQPTFSQQASAFLSKNLPTVTGFDKITHADGIIFAIVILLVAISLLTIGLMTEWSNVSQRVAAANANPALAGECQTFYEDRKKVIQGLTGAIGSLVCIALILAIIFMLKSRKSANKFVGKGIAVLVIVVTIFITMIVAGSIVAFKSVSICNNSTLTKVAYNSSLAIIITSSIGTLVGAALLKSDTILGAINTYSATKTV